MEPILEVAVDMTRNILYKANKSTYFVDRKLELRSLCARLDSTRGRRKLLLDISLGRYHKILGLFLDRPQEVAVMSLPHDEV